ncbi:MAG: ribosome hibernation-promoting factor, HPF/YfiA family [Candidatus Limnocylindria bacterium]
MKTLVKGRNVAVSDELRSYIERKLRRLDRLAHRGAQAGVEVISQASHSTDQANVVEVTLRLNGDVLRSTSSGATPEAALDVVLDKLERQMVRHNERPRARDHADGAVPVAGASALTAAERAADDAASVVVKVKRFDMEPLFEEDALARMDELGHSFFVFLNAESDRICVLYRRRDGRYGLIEPVVGR